MKFIFKKGSIKYKLVILPLVLVFLAILIIGASTAYLTHENLLDAKELSGFELVDQVVDRIKDNNNSIINITEIMENDMRVAASKISKDSEILTNEYIDNISEATGIDIIAVFDKNREVLYSNVKADIGWIPDNDHPLTTFANSSDSEMMEEIRQDSASEDGDYFKFGAIKTPTGGFIQFGINANRINNLTLKYGYQHLVEQIANSDGIEYVGFSDPDATIIAHSEKEQIDTTVPETEVAAAIRNKERDSFMYVNDKGVKIYEVSAPVEIDNNYLGSIKVTFSLASTYNAIYRNIAVIAIVGIISFIILAIILIMISKGILKNLNNTKSSLSNLAKGDFTGEVTDEFLNQNDEFGEMALAISELQDSMKRTIGNIAESSRKVTSSSEGLFASSRESTIVAEEIANTVQEMANGATTQAHDTEAGALKINEMGDLIEDNQENIDNLMDISDRVNGLKDEGIETIKMLIDGTDLTEKSVKEIHTLIMNTNDSAEKIESASQMIKNISEQTNLLALNAAIEAARAGEHGRGFAVVADEIRKLAEESNRFTLEIEDIIEDLMSKTNDTVTTIKSVEEVTYEQSQNVSITNNKFEDIAVSIENMINALKRVSASSSSMNDKKEQIIAIIENLSAISEENAASTEEASAAVEEQMASIVEIENASDTLKSLAEEMNENIKMLKY